MRLGNLDRAGFLDMVEQRNRAQYAKELMAAAAAKTGGLNLKPVPTKEDGDNKEETKKVGDIEGGEDGAASKKKKNKKKK